MAHLLLLDAPGGNDFTILEDAVRLGHEVTFFTSDLAPYRRQGAAALQSIALAREVVEIPGFDYAEFERAALSIHGARPFGAILCLIDIRLVESSRLAEKLGLRFLNTASCVLLRDKFRVREALARHGISQPAFALANGPGDLVEAVRRVGYPTLVKPCDGYGSQDVALLESVADLEAMVASLHAQSGKPTHYGLGVFANNRLSVERFVRGDLIGCDVFVAGTGKLFLGVNDKRMYAPPSFAIRGSCFPTKRHDLCAIHSYASRILDAVGFDYGAAHIEMILAEGGPYLVEVNARLVSAQIPYQMGYAFGRSLYADLIDLHLGRPLDDLKGPDEYSYCAIRWLVADREGALAAIRWPEAAGDWIRRVVQFKQPGDAVRPPRNNGDRIAYVMATGASQPEAEGRAEEYLAATRLELQ